MMYESILYSCTDGIARLTLNRPDRLNSFTAAMHAEVRDALDRLVADDARVLVLTGAGRGFCAGQDLSDRQMALRSISAPRSKRTTHRSSCAYAHCRCRWWRQ